MNEEIKKFWEDKGYKVEPRFTSELGLEWWHKSHAFGSMLWDAIDDENIVIVYTVALTFKDKPTVYYFDGSSWSEEQMIKILKLKAFL